jgi:hypothetical protein
MTTFLPDPVRDASEKFYARLEKPLSSLWCVIGWLVSTCVFLGLAAYLGGPTEGDAVESLYSTWAVSHGRWSCFYPLASAHHFVSIARPSTFIAPLYPLLSGAVAALLRIGHSAPFPSNAQLGTNCSSAFTAMYNWSVNSSAILPTIRIAYLSWFVLLAGAVFLLRSSNRGRTLWEPFALLLLAIASPALMALVIYFHPQDLLAVGLILGGLACVRRSSWLWAGVLIGLAFTSQQFALLALFPLLLIAPASKRIRFASGAILAAAVVILPLLAAAPSRVLRPALIGSGFSLSSGGTLVWEVHLHGAPQFFVSRLLPIIVGAVFALWANRRLGPRLVEPVALVSLIATTLGLRLLFEENLFGYYFMALTVTLLLLDVFGGKIRGLTIAWLALVTLAFTPIPWGFASNGQPWGLLARQQLPLWFAIIAVVLIGADLARKRIRWYIVAWLVFDCVALVKMPWMHAYLRKPLPIWLWQVLLVPSGLALALSPLVDKIRSADIRVDKVSLQSVNE